MTEELRDRIIRMAWEDRTTFDEIEKKTGYREADVIKVMRGGLKASSFKRWRKRVSGRVTKHRGLFEKSRAEIKEGRSRPVED
ncbi:TIGR03643 family protein [bacterium]|nr:TIGR03643 family protein [bacterium]